MAPKGRKAEAPDDALVHLALQAEALLFRRKSLLMGVSMAGTQHPMLPQTEQLEIDDIRPSLRALQTFFVDAATRKVHPVIDRLMEIGRKFDMERSTVALKRQKTKEKKPTSKDARETVDDFHDDTVECFLLETLHMVFEVLPLSDESGNSLEKISEHVVEYAFDHLKFSFSSAIRHEASKCLGTLSRTHLKVICDMFLNKLNVIKSNDDARNYVPYQKAVSELQFDLSDEKIAATTISYFSQLALAMNKMDRGVLREGVAVSMGVVLPRIVAAHPPVRDNPMDFRDFWKAYGSMYNTIGKWSKTKKHLAFCLTPLVKMNSAGIKTFFDQALELIRALLVSLRDKALMKPAIEGVLELFQSANAAFVEKDEEKFSSYVSEVTRAVFGKRRIVLDDRYLTNFVCIVARKHIHIAVRLIMEQLNAPGHDTKGAVISALAELSVQFPAQIGDQNVHFAPLVCKIVEDGALQTAQDAVILTGALGCFPAVRPSLSSLPSYVLRVGSFALSHDRGVALAALMGLRRYALLDPRNNLRVVLGLMIRSLLRPNLLQEDLIKAFQGFAELLTGYCDFLKSQDPSNVPDSPDGSDGGYDESGVDEVDEDGIPVSWTALRHRVEAIVLVWSAHDEAWIRSEALRLLTIFNRPEIRVLELSATEHTHFLADVLLARCGDPAKEMVDTKPAVSDILQHEYEDYPECIVLAWEILCDSLDIQQMPVTVADPEKMSLWRNRFDFLCQGLRLGDGFARIPSKEHVDCFFVGLLRLHLATHPEVVKLVRERAVQLHPSVLDDLLTRLRSFELEAATRKHRPRAGEDVPREMYVRPSFVALLRKIAGHLEFAYFSNSRPAGDMFSEVCVVWMKCRKELFTNASMYLRGDAAMTVQKILELGSIQAIVPQAGGTPADKLKHTKQLWDFLCSLMPPDLLTEKKNAQKAAVAGGAAKRPDPLGDSPARHYVEKAVLSALNAVLLCGALREKQFELSVLKFLDECVLRGKHVHEGITTALTTFLKLNPQHAYRFMQKTLAPDKGDTVLSDKHVVSRYDSPNIALAALVENFEEALEKWLVLIDIPMASMLMLVLIHLGHPSPFARRLVIRLANALAVYPKYPLVAQTALPDMTHTAENVYRVAAYQYSSEIASGYVEMTRPVIHEILRIIDAVKPPIVTRDHMLAILEPWVSNIHAVLTQHGGGEDGEVAVDSETTLILNELLRITHRNAEFEVLHGHLQILWSNMVRGGGDENETALNALLRHMLSGTPGLGISKEESLDLCRMVCTFVARTPLGSSLLLGLVAALRNYTENVPADNQAFMNWHEKQLVDEDVIGVIELQGFKLLSDVVFVQQYGATLAPFLPLLCTNALALFGPKYPGECLESLELLSVLLHTLAIRLAPDQMSRRNASKFRDEHFPDPRAHPNAYKKFHDQSVPFPPPSVAELARILSVHRPDFQAAWADLTLTWASQTPNTLLCTYSLRLFEALARQLEPASLNTVLRLMYSGFRHQRLTIVDACLDVLVSLVSSKVEDTYAVYIADECVAMLAVCTGICLHSKEMSVFRGSIALLRALLDRFVVAVVMSRMQPVFAAGLDSTMFPIIERALAADTASTHDDALWLAGIVCQQYGPGFAEQPHGILQQVLLAHVAHFASGDRNAKPVALQTIDGIRSHARLLEGVRTALDECMAAAVLADDTLDPKDEGRLYSEVVPRLVEEVVKVFGTPQLVIASIRHTAKMAQAPGIAFYRRAYTNILCELIERRVVGWSTPESIAVAQVLCDLAYSYNEDVRRTALRAIGVMAGDPSIDQKNFNFLRHPPGRKMREAMPVRDSQTANRLPSDEELESRTHALHVLMHGQLFHMQSTPPQIEPLPEHTTLVLPPDLTEAEATAAAEAAIPPMPKSLAAMDEDDLPEFDASVVNMSVPDLELTAAEMSGLEHDAALETAAPRDSPEQGDKEIEAMQAASSPPAPPRPPRAGALAPLNVAEIEAEIAAEKEYGVEGGAQSDEGESERTSEPPGSPIPPLHTDGADSGGPAWEQDRWQPGLEDGVGDEPLPPPPAVLGSSPSPPPLLAEEFPSSEQERDAGSASDYESDDGMEN